MRVPRMLAMILAAMGGYLVLSGAPASATPLTSGSVANTAVGEPLVAYARDRRYRQRHYAPRRAYRPHRSYRRHYSRPRTVCRTQYTTWGPRRVCYRR